MPLKFNMRGYLEPPKRYEIGLEEFENIFVEGFPDKAIRRKLFEGYCEYLNDFKSSVIGDFVQWVGGSFTTKKRNPRDVDLLSIIPHKTFETHKELIEQKFRKSAKNIYGVDAYFVASYPEEHKRFPLYQGNLVYWDNQFSMTRKNRAGKQFSRGYIQITHQL